MKTGLLKKIKKNWTIVHYKDELASEKNLIYRALYKGCKVDYAWIEDKGRGDEISKLVLGIAHQVSWRKDWEYSLARIQERRRNKRLEKRRENKIKKAKVVWP